MMLPHGLDGAGPEHSSSRLERFLQLTNDRYEPNVENNINMHVAFPTTPAQYFHLLRRQMIRNYRKPLIIAGPKGLLRLAVSDSALILFEVVTHTELQAASSRIEDMSSGTKFQPVLADNSVEAEKVNRIVLLSGKVYYDLLKEREAQKAKPSSGFVDPDTIALIRVEELAPFPFQKLEEVLGQYPNASDYVWLQEEPRNQGAWTHVEGRVKEVLKVVKGRETGLVYRGRRESAVPATGIGKVYQAQQREVLEGAFRKL